MRRTRTQTCRLYLAVPALTIAAGCAIPTTVFRVTDHREPGVTKRYREHFADAYYRFDPAGNVEILLTRRQPPTHDTPPLTQTVHLQGLWPCVPGRTVAHRTQINATVTYSIRSGALEAVFEGAGSLFLDKTTREGRLIGELALATLRPTYRSPTAGDLFERAELSGCFAAHHDPRRTVQLANDLSRVLARVE